MGPEGEKAIRELAKGEKPIERLAGIAGLCNLQERGLPQLLTMLQDSDDVIRLAACEAILYLEPTHESVIPALKELSHHPDPWFRLKVAILFGRVKQEPSGTADFLKKWMAREPIPLLPEDISCPGGLVWVVLDVLSTMGEDGERAATEWEKTELGMAVKEVLDFFPRYRAKKPELIPAIAVLAILYPNPDTRADALQVLRGYGSSGETLRAILGDLQKSDNEQVRSAAEKAYRELPAERNATPVE
jgi:HEAT repeat protein